MDRGTTDHDSGDAAVQGTPSIALFVTCLVDLMRPSVGFASLALLERAGCSVQVPAGQTCCGQPGYNSGDYAGARAVAQRTVTLLEGYDYVVIPSGSCAGMLRLHYPRLLEGAWRRRAEQLATRCYELTQFLHDVCGIDLQPAADTSTVAYHDACAGLRELGVRRQPRELLAAAGIDVCDPAQGEVCCGFGGTFCAKLPEVSAKNGR
jgi:L-lactate dehydrogenase complex protein LldE